MPLSLPQPSPPVSFVLRHVRVVPGLCSFQDHETGYELVPRRLTDTNVFYMLRGELALTVDGERAVGRAGDFLLSPRHTRQSAVSLTPGITFLSIHVEAALAGGRDVFELLQPPRHRTLGAGSRLASYCRAAAEEYTRPDPAQTRQMLGPWVKLVTLELIREDDAAGRLSPTTLDPVVAAVLQALADRVAQPTTLDDLAAMAGYSPQHLNRRFKEALGLTPLQHLRYLRMEAAASLLAEGTLDVAAVAPRVGYDDPFYFSRAFKAFHSRSPSDYRDGAGSDSPSPSA